MDQVEEQHSAAHVALGDGNHQTQVGLGQLFLRFLVALLHALGDLDLFLCGQQGNLADLLQVHADRVVHADAFGHAQVDVFRLDQLLRGNGVKFVHHVHAQAFQHFIDLVDLVGVDLQLHELVRYFFLGNGALGLGFLVQFVELYFDRFPRWIFTQPSHSFYVHRGESFYFSSVSCCAS